MVSSAADNGAKKLLTRGGLLMEVLPEEPKTRDRTFVSQFNCNRLAGILAGTKGVQDLATRAWNLSVALALGLSSHQFDYHES